MYVRDLPLTLERIHDVLRPGGRVAASVWGGLESNPFHAVPIDAVRTFGAVPDPPPEYLRAFSIGDDDLRRALEDAGFEGVTLKAVPAGRSYESLATALTILRGFPPLLRLLECVPEARRELAWHAIALGFEPYAGPGERLRLPGEQLVVSGTA
jgi:hypothetical protein